MGALNNLSATLKPYALSFSSLSPHRQSFPTHTYHRGKISRTSFLFFLLLSYLLPILFISFLLLTRLLVVDFFFHLLLLPRLSSHPHAGAWYTSFYFGGSSSANLYPQITEPTHRVPSTRSWHLAGSCSFFEIATKEKKWTALGRLMILGFFALLVNLTRLFF